MNDSKTIYVLGCGAVGFPLATFLSHAGRRVVAVRTSRKDGPPGTDTVTVHNGKQVSASVETTSLPALASLEGLITVTAKAQANEAIALALKEKRASGPVVIMQNGVGVEKPFVDAGFAPVYRCILYVTAQGVAEYEFSFRPVTASPIGVISGDDAGLEEVVQTLTTDAFPFRTEANIEREIWKKAIINSVFNSICPLLDVDNGVFVRDENVAGLAREVVRECVALMDRLNVDLDEAELMSQIMRISQGSQRQLISTLQDIKSGRPTEIAFLNLAIARVAGSLQPELQLPKTELLGKMVLAKSLQTSA